MNVNFTNCEHKSEMYCLEGFLMDHLNLFSFKFIGNSEDNFILNVKEITLEYNDFVPTKSELKDCVLKEQQKMFLEACCLNMVEESEKAKEKEIYNNEKDIEKEKDNHTSQYLQEIFKLPNAEVKNSLIIFQVEDSFIEEICYSVDANDLIVKFENNDNLYIYKNVPIEVYFEFVFADNKGVFLNKDIKNNYKFEKSETYENSCN